MLRKLLLRSFFGLGLACLITFVALTIFTFQGIEVSIFQVWLYMFGAIILGVYFGISSLIFEIENWSPLKQLVVHFVLSSMLWFIIAIFMVRWMPFTVFTLIFSFFIFIGIYVLIGLGFSIYYKKIETELNDSVK